MILHEADHVIDRQGAEGAFYDARPCPPPEADLDRHRRAWTDVSRRRAEYHLLWPTLPFREDLDVLVAECGTCRAARYALCWPSSHVTGIDIDSGRLDCAYQLKRKYSLVNLDLNEVSTDRVVQLKRNFDLIVCTGVHHLPDPDLALCALRSVLRPEGAMHLMVNAPYGRTGVYMLQKYCRRLGIGTSGHEIGDLIAVLESLPRQHPLTWLLRASGTLGSETGLVDVLLNACDRPYSVDELFDCIERADLRFGRWHRQAPYLPQCGAIARSPHAARLATLPPRDQFAAVELWRGTFVRHSVIVYPGRAQEEGQPIRFDGDGWLGYVPLRLPKTLCVQQGMPPGAAAMLLNQGHANAPDLIVPIDAFEKRSYEAIDGTRTIGEIVRPSPRARLRESTRRGCALFERLWRYDQVVFDASGRC